MAGDALIDFLTNNPARAFRPRPFYQEEDDSAVYIWDDRPSHARRIDHVLTIFLTDEGEEIAGMEIKGVRSLLERIGSFDLHLRFRKVSLAQLLAGYLLLPHSPSEEAREKVETLRTKCAGVTVSV